MESEEIESSKVAQPKLPTQAHIICGWPIALVFIGGAIGGGLGGAAYGINVAIYKSHMPVTAKIALNILTGVSAFILWVVAVYLIRGKLG